MYGRQELEYELRWTAAAAPAGDPNLVAVQDRRYNALQETRPRYHCRLTTRVCS